MGNNNYKIDPVKYDMLKKWCLGYWRKKHEIQTVLESGGNRFASHSKIKGLHSNPTQSKALKIAELETDCALIEKTVKSVCADYDTIADSRNLLDLSEFILLNVTTSRKYYSWRSLKARGYNLPAGKNKFYELRRKFFYELNKHFEN